MEGYSGPLRVCQGPEICRARDLISPGRGLSLDLNRAAGLEIRSSVRPLSVRDQLRGLEKNLAASIIVVYKERNSDLERCLGALCQTLDHLGLWDQVEILESGAPNKSLARNSLAADSQAEFLVFLDSDAYPCDSWLHELLKPFSDPGVGAVGGSNLLRPGAGEREILADKILTFPLATWRSSARYRVAGIERDTDEAELSSCNLAVRRLAFVQAGGFPADLIPCEENQLLNRIQARGWRLVYNPLAIVFHNRDRLFLPYCRKLFSYGRGRARMIRRGEGGIHFLPRPSLEILYLAMGLGLHYLSYLSGLVWGLIKND